MAVENLSGSSRFLLLGDHAGRGIPEKLNGLGLNPADLDRHIAWDIGVAGLGLTLSARLDAAFVHQRYSRLVIDCNRDPADEDSIAPQSDKTIIPGNQDLTVFEREARRMEIFTPYQEKIDAVIKSRKATSQPTILVSLHSFTPKLQAHQRPWRFGVLHRKDSPFSSAVLARLKSQFGDAVGDNAPYAMDGVDYTIPHHADGHGLDYLELEVRQDIIADRQSQHEIGALLSEVLSDALQ